MKNLGYAKIGEVVKVKRVHGHGGMKRRVLDMGLTKGTEVLIRKSAPLGDPLQINLRGFELSIRRKDAQIIEVE